MTNTSNSTTPDKNSKDESVTTAAAGDQQESADILAARAQRARDEDPANYPHVDILARIKEEEKARGSAFEQISRRLTKWVAEKREKIEPVVLEKIKKIASKGIDFVSSVGEKILPTLGASIGVVGGGLLAGALVGPQILAMGPIDSWTVGTILNNLGSITLTAVSSGLGLSVGAMTGEFIAGGLGVVNKAINKPKPPTN